jgi:outer membrane receptor for ferrienterochelin and colicins
VGTSCQAWAQVPEDTLRLPARLKTVVVTASYANDNPMSSPISLSVINSRALERRGATTLKQALEREVGLRMSTDAILGSSVSVNGIGGQNVKVLVDGVPVIGRVNGNIDLSQLLLTNVSRIEWVEGPLSVNYGTDALGGTVNLITRKDQVRRLEATAQTYVESVGQYNMNALLGYKNNKNRCGLVFARNFFDGWSEADTTRNKEWKPREQYVAEAYYVRQSNTTVVQYKSDFFNERILNRGNPRPPYCETAFDDWYATRRINNVMVFAHDFGKGNRIDVTAGYSHYKRMKNTYFTDLVNVTTGLTTNPGDQDTTVFGLITSRGTWSVASDSSKLHTQLGYDVNVESGVGLRLKDGSQSITDVAVFGSTRWRPTGRIMAQGGLRAAYNSDYPHPIIPSLVTRIELHPNLTLRANYARGFRSPSLKELYFFFVDANHNITGNTQLQAERSNHFSLSLQWLKAMTRTTLLLKPTVYFNDVHNLITLAQVGEGAFSYVNIGAYQTTGGSIRSQLETDRWQIDLDLGLTAHRADSSWSASPEFGLQLTYEVEPWDLGVNGFCKFYRRSKSFFLDETGAVSEQSLAPYQMADITLSKSLPRARMVMVGGVKNLFDVTRIATGDSGGQIHGSGGYQLIAWGRSLFLSLRIKLGYD